MGRLQRSFLVGLAGAVIALACTRTPFTQGNCSHAITTASPLLLAVKEESMKNYRATLFIMLAVILCTVSSAEAGKRKCADDYRRFCSQWGLETRGLENCMRRHGDQLTHACVRGLIAAGAVSQAEVDRRRKQSGR